MVIQHLWDSIEGLIGWEKPSVVRRIDSRYLLDKLFAKSRLVVVLKKGGWGCVKQS